MTNTEKSEINCACGVCGITLADGRAIQNIRCGCEDCRQALQWAHTQGGRKPSHISNAYYIPADIIETNGVEYMKAYKLRQDGRSTRVFCKKCYSMIGVDHPAYQSNVFMISEIHCHTSCDLSVSLTCYLFMNDYTEDMGPAPDGDVPLFTDFRFPQEYKRFRSLPVVNNAFRARETEPTGMTFTAFLEQLGPVSVLDLPKGQNLLGVK